MLFFSSVTFSFLNFSVWVKKTTEGDDDPLIVYSFKKYNNNKCGWKLNNQKKHNVEAPNDHVIYNLKVGAPATVENRAHESKND